jgi:hypothetical protein
MDYSLPHFRVDFQDWLAGNNLYDDYPNGGLLASASGYNPFRYPGLLVPNKDYSTTTITSGLVRAPVIAADITTDSGFNFVAVGSQGDPNDDIAAGTFYLIDPETGAMSVLTNPGGAAINYNYQLGWSEAVTGELGNVFITSEDDVTLVNPSHGTLRVDQGWGNANGISGGLNSLNMHPMARFEEFIYIGDGNNVHQIDIDAGTAIEDYFEAIPTNFEVTSMEQHKSYLLMAITQYAGDILDPDYSVYNSNTGHEILAWDGFSPSFTDRFPVPNQVTAMRSTPEGICYIWTTKHFGYLNGSRFEPLRELTSRVYKHMIVPAPHGGVMYAQGTKVVRYSSAVPGGKKFFTVQADAGLTITSILQAFETRLMVFTDSGDNAVAGKNLLWDDLDAGTPGTKSFAFNQRVLRVNCKVRHVVIETEGLNGGSVQVQYYDQNGDLRDCGTFNGAGAQAGKRAWNFAIHSHPGTNVIKPYITISGGAKLRAFEFYYEQTGQTNNA